MKSIGKIIGIFFLLLLLLVIAAAFALTHLVDPNSYKEQLQQLARDKGKVELELNGDIGWSLFPWLGLELTDTRIASLESPEQPFADVKLLALSVRVLPLFKKEVQMSDIRLDGLQLNLQRDADGIGNWEYIGKTLEEIATHRARQQQRRQQQLTAETSAAPNISEEIEKRIKPLRLDIDSLIINSASVRFHDQQSGLQFTAENLQITTAAIKEDRPFAIKFSGFAGISENNLRTRFSANAEAVIDRSNQRYLINGLQLEGELTGDPLQNKPLNILARGDLSYQADQATASWEQLRLTLNQMKVSGELHLSQLKTTPSLNGQLNVSEFNARDFLASIGRPLDDKLAANALTKVSAVARLQGTFPEFSATDLAISLDNTQLTGAITYLPSKQQPNLGIHLQADQLNLDEYLISEPVAANQQREQAVKEQLADTPSASLKTELPSKQDYLWDTKSLLPLASLRGLDLQTDLQFASLTYQKLPLSNLHLQLAAKQQQLQLQKLTAQLFGGSLSASGKLDVSTDTPKISLTSKVVYLPLEQLLAALDKPVTLSGLLDSNLAITTQGNSQQQWINQLQGSYNLELHKGQLRDVNLDQQLCLAVAAVNGRAPQATDSSQRHTAFSQLSSKMNINRGVAQSNDLRLGLAGLRASGKGHLDLNTLNLDYQVGIKILGDQRAMPDSACQINPRLTAIEWPFRCQGPVELAAKSCRFDQQQLGQILKQTATQEINTKLQKTLDKKLKGKAPPELQDALKGLFK